MSDLTNVFTDIADAIRAKTQTQITYKPVDMASAIESISTGTASTAYCWKKGTEKFYFNFDKAVAEKSDFENSKILVERFVEFQKQNSGVTAIINSSVYSADVGLFVAIGNKKLLTSTNGINWTDQTPSVLANITMEQIIYLSNELKRFIIVSSGGGAYLSRDGIAWERMSTGVSGYLYSLTYSETLNLVVAVGASGVILTSSDGGIHWDNQTSPVSTSLRSIIYSKRLNLFVVVGDGGTILTSPDGINWTQQTNTNSTRLNSIAYNSELNLFVAVGGNSSSNPNTTVILTSSDGINWTEQTSGVSNIAWLSIVYSSELNVFMAVGGSGAILTSPDGINWTRQTSGVSSKLNSIVYSSELDLFIAVGESGVILTSRINQKIISNIQNYFGVVASYTKTSDSEFTISSSLQTGTFVRSANDDLDFWS